MLVKERRRTATPRNGLILMFSCAIHVVLYMCYSRGVPGKELMKLVEARCCFTSTETVGLLGTGTQDVHLDFHTTPELWKELNNGRLSWM